MSDSSETTKKSTNPKCAKVGCITDPCIHKRPPITEGGHCVDFNDGVNKAGVPQEILKQTSKEETASFHYDLGNLHKLVHTLDSRITKIEKDICKIKEVIDNFHSTCKYSQFEED